MTRMEYHFLIKEESEIGDIIWDEELGKFQMLAQHNQINTTQVSQQAWQQVLGKQPTKIFRQNTLLK